MDTDCATGVYSGMVDGEGVGNKMAIAKLHISKERLLSLLHLPDDTEIIGGDIDLLVSHPDIDTDYVAPVFRARQCNLGQHDCFLAWTWKDANAILDAEYDI